MKATAKKSWRNTNDVTRWIRQTNAPTPIGRDEQTGEFVFGQSGAGRSDAEVLAGQQQAAAGQGRSIRAVTEEDLKDEEFDRFVMERSRQKELEEWVASTTAPTEFVTRLVTGRNQTEQPMQATSELAGGLLEPTNIATMGVPLSAGAKTLGLSRLTKAGGARAARVLDRAAAKGIAGMETGAAKFQEIIQKGTKISPENQIKMAKWSVAGGIGGVFGLDSDIPGVAQAQDAAKFIGGAYLGYKAGLGVLRTVQKIAGPTATILRVASDAGEGFDDIAQASVATKLEAFPELSLVREALENPTRFRPIESTPARLAADPRLGKQTRAIADALASPAIVQGVRGTSAVATGAVKGAVANAPFVALALNADEDKAAANMFGMGVGFGAVGGAAGRFTGLEQRRTESRAFDTARMLMDVELAGGDVTKTIQTYSTQQLGDLAAMQGFFRDKVDFVPLDGIERAGDSDFIKNAKVQFQNGAAGLFIQAPPGEKARVFVNLDAKRDGIVPHELGHALLKSGALGSAQADTIRSFTTRRYTQVGVEARGREYATAMIQNENAAKFPGQNFPVTPASISAKMDELGQSGLLRGDMDPLDWARDEIFAEDFRQASQSMDFAGIRRHLPADGSWLGSMENFLGAQANALSISGVRIDPVTGQPDPLFKANPILATDPVLKKQLDQYLNNYRNWINHPDQTKVRGVRVAPAGRASDLANNPQVTFHDYGNGVMANEFARMDPTTGQAVFREQRDITAETIKRQQQVKTLVGSKLIPATDPNLGPKKTADGRVTVRGRILPQKFDFLNGFAQHQRGFARQFETAAATGESMQVRYHSIGSSDSGAFQIKKLGNLEAITREIIPWGWELSGPNNLLASVLDLTQFRNRAIKAINAGEPNIGRLYNNDIKLIEADLKQWMDNHRNDLPGSNKIGEQRRDAINSLIGIGTNINKAANPFSGKIAGPSSAIKQFRLDRVDAAVGTGRLGFHFDYDKANNNLLPEIPTPLPDLSRDLPTDKGQAMPDITITPDEAKRNGLVGPVYHGSPDFKGQKFDLKYRARNSGLSRGGFSFTDNVESAKGYASNKIDSTQSAVDSANDVMRELAGRMDSGLKVDGFADSTELPEFNSSYVDDIESLGNYFDEIANKIPKDLGDRLRVAASKTNEPANPVVVEAYLKNPKVTDINGKKLWLTDNPDDIFVSGTTRPAQGQAMPNNMASGEQWDAYAENLRVDVESWSPARDTGRTDYEMMDVVDRFVDFARNNPQLSGEQLNKNFYRAEKPTATQRKKLNAALENVGQPPKTIAAPQGQAMPDAAGPKGKDVFARSLEDIKLSIPANERWIGTKLPGQPVRAADGRRFLEHDLNTKTGAMNVTQAAIDKAWADAIAVTGPAASRAISELQEKGFTMKPPPEAHWKAAENLPNKDRLWYEISSEAMSESFPDFSQNELGKTMDVTAATSPLADPNYNARLAIAILAEDFQKTPSVTPAVVQTSVKDALMGEFGKAEQRKVGSFGGTFRFLTGLSDDPPLTTNDRQVAASMGIPDSAFGTYPVLYELQSRFGNNLRDHVNANGGMNSQFGPFQSHQLQALSWVQQRAEQRLQRRTNITDEEAFNGDAYASAFKLAADDLREAGIDVPRDPITGLPRFTASVLSDPRVQQILTPPGTEFLKSTIQTMEMNTKLREDGKKFADALDESKKLSIPGNIKLAEQVLQRAAKSLTLRTADKADKSIKLPSPLSKLASVFGAANADITRIEFGRGTFQGDVSPNVRIPMDAIPEKYRPAFMAVLGKHFYQAAQAASRFKSVDAAQAQSYSIWMHGKGSMDGLENLAQAFTNKGHEANISQRPNGVLIDVHPKFTDQGPVPINYDSLQELANLVLGEGNSSVIPREYNSIYLEKQEYDSTILKATKELLNEHANKIAEATSISLGAGKNYLRGDKALDKSTIPLNRRAEKIRDSYRQRIDQLQSSEKELKSLFKNFEADTRMATGEMQKRIDAYHKKASKPSNPSKPTGNNPSAEDLAAFK